MLGFLRNLIRNRDGNAVIEMAVALPILIIIMTGVIDFGYQFSVANSMRTVSSETARLLAIKRITAAEAPAYARGRLMQAFGTYQVTTSTSGSDVTVNVSLPARAAILVDITGLLSQGNMSASSTMRVIS